jgi:hypothetical protein
MTEPTPGTPSPLPAEPTEPAAQDPAIDTDEALDADLEENGDGEETEADELDLTEEDEAEESEEEALEGEPSAEGAVPEAVGPPPGGSAVRRRAGVAPVAPRAATQSELAVRVTDNPSRFFVIATVVVFVGILAFGLLAGSGGVLTPRATPTPVPSLTASPSAAPSASAAASASPAASTSPSAAASASPS